MLLSNSSPLVTTPTPRDRGVNSSLSMLAYSHSLIVEEVNAPAHLSQPEPGGIPVIIIELDNTQDDSAYVKVLILERRLLPNFPSIRSFFVNGEVSGGVKWIVK